MPNKIKYGLKNVYYSVITLVNNVPVYATPVPIPGAVNLNLSASGEKTEFYADDSAYFVTTANDGYEGTLEIALIPDSFRTAVLGEAIDANGAYVENADVLAKNFALMFEFAGDANAVRHVLYNVNASRPDVAGATKEKSIQPQTETLNIKASPAVDTKNVKSSLPYSIGDYYTNFFTAVYLEDATVNTKGADPAAFSKAAPADVVVTSTSDGTPSVKNVILNGADVPGVSITLDALEVTIASAYVAGLNLANGTYPIVVEFTVGNSVTYTLTVTA